MDKIKICDLQVFYRVGVPDQERAAPQRLLLTITLHTDFSGASAADDLGKTIDYAAVARFARDFGQGKEWRLIEKLAVEMAEAILNQFRPRTVDVEIKKFPLPEARCVSVSVTRPRGSF